MSSGKTERNLNRENDKTGIHRKSPGTQAPEIPEAEVLAGNQEKIEMRICRNDRGFAYLDFESGSHGHIKTRLWVHEALVQKREEKHSLGFGGSSGHETLTIEEIAFPVRKARIHETPKGGIVLRPDDGYTVYFVEIPSGYRGSAKIEKCRPSGQGEARALDAIVMATGQRYHSGQGATGETSWALVNADGPIEVYGRHTGRRIDREEVAFRLTPDGEREELITDEGVCDLLGG